ncbi:MAG: ASKHA domain-containing protein [Kiritimatiellia bacterium]
MKTNEIKVTFQPAGRSVYVLPGTLLLEAAGRAGIPLQTPCGGRGTCGKCKVRVIDGHCPASSSAQKALTADQLKSNYRLACQTYIEETLVVEIPHESRMESSDQILTHHADSAGRALRPVVAKVHFRLDPPAGGRAESDVSRIKAALPPLKIPYRLLVKLSAFLRTNNWQGTAVIAGDRLLQLEKGDTTASTYGIAIDMGTTTVVGTLLDLASGDECAVSSTMNPQVAFGDDVISRISRVRDHYGTLADIQHSAIKAVNSVIHNLADKAGIDPQSIYEVVVAGNSTMQELLCGLNPCALGEVPFVHVFDRALTLPAQDLGLAINPGGEVFIFPQIGGFVGGDTVAGMLAAGMNKSRDPTLLVDIGTNGEIVVAYDGKFQAASTAAGPAFEGARITQGMRATSGAIEKVVIRDDVLLNVIGNTRPAGLCGTALIDSAAELLRRGILDETGRILPADEAPADTPEAVRSRLVTVEGQTNFLLVPAEDSSSGDPIYLWQKDIRELQLAAGAIRAGINILLRRVGLKPDDLSAVLLAGAFGNFIRRNNARRIGLLPQIPCAGIHFIGNAASLGAKLALLSEDERQRAEILRQKTQHVDLSLDPEFQMEFGNAMTFPAGDADSCS